MKYYFLLHRRLFTALTTSVPTSDVSQQNLKIQLRLARESMEEEKLKKNMLSKYRCSLHVFLSYSKPVI